MHGIAPGMGAVGCVQGEDVVRLVTIQGASATPCLPTDRLQFRHAPEEGRRPHPKGDGPPATPPDGGDRMRSVPVALFPSGQPR